MLAILAHHQHFVAYLRQGFAASVTLALLIAVFAPLEQIYAVRKTRVFAKGWQTNFGWYVVNAFAVTLLLGPPTIVIGWAIHAVLPTSFTSAAAGLPLGVRMVLAMIVGEFGFYWGHRWSHEWPLLWRFHAVHHSATHLNFMVNTRAHPIDAVFTRICGLVLLYATGLTSLSGPHPAFIPAVVLFVGAMWSYFIHANLRWRFGPFEEVLATPAFHHWHHTLDDHKDHNYAAMLPFVDRLFGTFYLPRHWPEEYGASTYMPETLTGQMLEPFAPTLRPSVRTVVRVGEPAEG